MSTTRSEPNGSVPLGASRRTNVRTIALSSLGALTAIAFFFIQRVLESAATEVTGARPPSGNSTAPLPVVGFILVIVLIRSGYEIASWLARRYRVDSRELVIDEGILTRHHRVAPFARVQQVSLRQQLIAQLLDIAEVRIDTAGEGGSTTIRLRALRRRDAEALRSFILERRGILQPPEAMPDGQRRPADDAAVGPLRPEQMLLTLTPGRLLLAALTKSSLILGLPIAFAAAVWLLAVTATASGSEDRGQNGAGLLVFLAFVGFIGLTLRVVNLVLGHWGFTLSVKGDDLHLRYGLLEVRQLTIPRRRVQQITIVDNPVRRALGVASLTMHSAAGGASDDRGTTRFDLPLLDRATVDQFVVGMMGADEWRIPALVSRPRPAGRRAVVRRMAFLASVAALAALSLYPFGLAVFGLVVIGLPWGRLAHRRAGHGTSSSLIAFSRGTLHHLVELVPLARIQSCRTSTSVLQRRHGLATLHVDIARDRSSPHLFDMDASLAGPLLRQLPRISSNAAERRDGHR